MQCKTFQLDNHNESTMSTYATPVINTVFVSVIATHVSGSKSGGWDLGGGGVLGC